MSISDGPYGVNNGRQLKLRSRPRFAPLTLYDTDITPPASLGCALPGLGPLPSVLLLRSQRERLQYQNSSRQY